MKCADISGVVVVLLCSILSGCASAPSKSSQALFLMNQRGDLRGAWNVISEDKRRSTTASTQSQCETQVVYLKILNAIVHENFLPDNADILAQQSYNYVVDHCRNQPARVSLAENSYGTYLIGTLQAGRAIPHIQKAIDLSPPESYDRFINQANLGHCYRDMGKRDMQEYYSSLSISSAEKYYASTHFTRLPHVDQIARIKTYCDLLIIRLNDLSWSMAGKKRSQEMHRTWMILEKLVQRWFTISSQFFSYIGPIQSFAFADETEFARSLLKDIQSLNDKYPYHDQMKAELGFLAAEAAILHAEKQFGKAAESYEQWVRNAEKEGGKKLSGDDYRRVGLAVEAEGDIERAMTYLQRAVDEYEKLRSSFAVRSRSQVLSGATITTYWGLLRCAVLKFRQSGSTADFSYAVQVARMLRARQFGELLGIDDQLSTGFSLLNLQLQENELLVNIVMTDSALIIFEIALDHQDIRLVAIDREKFSTLLREIRSSLSTPSRNTRTEENLLRLSESLFAASTADFSNYQRIIGIPDGMLAGIPLALLSETTDRYTPFIQKHDVLFTPSLSYLIKQRTMTYADFAPRLLAIADPVFSETTAPRTYQGEALSIYVTAMQTLGLFQPIPETRYEVENIASLFPSTDTTLLFRENATKEKLLSQPLSDFKYLHFATHGVLGNQIPGIEEPAILLSSSGGGRLSDSFLRLSEVEQMQLHADLTVLSACNTGSGEFFTGEGIMGLGRAFLLAGSQSVIVSLWPVADETTAQLMIDFYDLLRQGYDRAASLRMAQRKMMHAGATHTHEIRGIRRVNSSQPGERNLHPFYWAPFVLIGDSGR